MTPLLYHYTSFDALCKIITGRKLRLTNVSFLNDSKEYKYGISLFKQEILDYEERNNILEKFNLELLDNFSFQNSTYSISFCERGDDLNLWRGYCPKEGGVAIGFNKDEIFTNNKIIINKCKYGNPYKDIICDSNYVRIKEKFQNVNTIHKDLEHIKFTFDLGHVKHSSFIDENEWRGISLDNQYTIEYFVKNSIIIPYFETSFNKSSIKEIIIGPTAHQDKIKLALEIMFRKHKINSNIIKSEIAFVQY